MKIRRGLLCLALTAATAGPVGAAWAEGGPTADEIDRLETAIASQDCTLTKANQDEILAAAGLTLSEAEVIVSRLLENGQAVQNGDYLTLTTHGCS